MENLSNEARKAMDEHRAKWQYLASLYANQELEMQHFAHIASAEDHLLSVACPLTEDPEEQAFQFGLMGLIWAAVPYADILILQIDTRVVEKESMYFGEDAVLMMIIEAREYEVAGGEDVLVTFERHVELQRHWLDEDGVLQLQDITHEVGVTEESIRLDAVESLFKRHRSGESLLQDELQVGIFGPLIQSVEYGQEHYGWDVLPEPTLERAVTVDLVRRYGPRAFERARQTFRGLGSLTPDVQLQQIHPN